MFNKSEEQKLNALSLSLIEVEKKLKDRAVTNIQYNEEIRRLEKIIEEKKINLKLLEDNIDNINNITIDKEQQLDLIKKESEKVQNEINNNRIKISELKSSVDEELVFVKDKIKKEYRILSDLKIESEKLTKDFRDNSLSYKSKLLNLQGQISLAVKSKEIENNKLDTLSQEISLFESKKNQLENVVNSLSAEKESLSNELKFLKHNISAEKEAWDSHFENLNIKNKEKKAELERKELEVKELISKEKEIQESNAKEFVKLNNVREGLEDTDRLLRLKEAKVNQLVRKYKIDEEIKKRNS